MVVLYNCGCSFLYLDGNYTVPAPEAERILYGLSFSHTILDPP